MFTVPGIVLAALAAAIVLMALIAMSNGRRAASLRQARDQAIRDGRNAYAQGHEDGLNDQRRRQDGELVQVSTAYRQGYAYGQAEAREAAAGRRNGKPTRAA
jgi:hypothetical protein